MTGLMLDAARGDARITGEAGARALLRRFWRHRLAVAASIFLLVLAGLCLAAPLVERALGIDGGAIDLLSAGAAPDAAHWLGRDELGRDLLARLLYGGRVSLLVGLVTSLLAAAIGTVIGLIAGWFGGVTDAALMRLTDGVIGLPMLPVLIILAAVDLGKLGLPQGVIESPDLQLWRIIIIIALFGWTRVARLVRGATLSVREREYVRAALALGARPARILWRHILPNVLSPIIVAATMSAGFIILEESVLSFLSLGIQPPQASWGNMLTNAQQTIWSAPRLVALPGLLIFATVIAFNFLGDGLQDALDPRTAGRD